MKNFALIGAAGYIAPRHMRAIKESGNNLIVALDTFDSVGVIDSYFPGADFFTEIERFDRHISKLRYEEEILLDYFSICTPNYLHDSHIRFGLRQGADVICEKPLVLNPWNIDRLKKIELNTGNRIWNILQLRHHETIINLQNKIKSDKKRIYDIDLTYITSRGNWYYTSWKGDKSKSGGIATNIGIHFFDMLIYLFGDVEKNIVHIHEHDRASGFLLLKKARVRWFLSINSDLLPDECKEKNKTTFRSIKINDEQLEFSDGFNNLHTLSYENIIQGNGYGIEETEKSIKTAYDVRNAKPVGLKGDFHPFAKKKKTNHPFNKK